MTSCTSKGISGAFWAGASGTAPRWAKTARLATTNAADSTTEPFIHPPGSQASWLNKRMARFIFSPRSTDREAEPQRSGHGELDGRPPRLVVVAAIHALG